MMMMTMLFATAMKMNMGRVESSEAAAAIWRECLAVFGQHTLSMINIPPAGQSSYPRMVMRKKDKSFTYKIFKSPSRAKARFTFFWFQMDKKLTSLRQQFVSQLEPVQKRKGQVWI